MPGPHTASVAGNGETGGALEQMGGSHRLRLNVRSRLMPNWKAILSCSCLALLGMGGCGSPPDSQEIDGAQGEVKLFNGEDLSGFYTWLVDSGYEDPRGVFQVVDREIRISGDGLGYLGTMKSYSNYRLVAEYRWGSQNTVWGDRMGKARDSGVFLHATGADGNSHDGEGAFMAAIECNLFEGATGDFLLIRGDDASGQLIAPIVDVRVRGERDADGWPWWNQYGEVITIDTWGRVNWVNKDPDWKDEFGFRGRNDLESPAGDWNLLEIECRDHEISVRLNGRLVNHATNVYPQEGRILLQCEGSEIFFRRLDLYPLIQETQ